MGLMACDCVLFRALNAAQARYELHDVQVKTSLNVSEAHPFLGAPSFSAGGLEILCLSSSRTKSWKHSPGLGSSDCMGSERFISVAFTRFPFALSRGCGRGWLGGAFAKALSRRDS